MTQTERTGLIRQWWYLYAEVLRWNPDYGSPLMEEFKAHDAKVAEADITGNSRPMPRDGAEDLADQCDRIRGKR